MKKLFLLLIITIFTFSNNLSAQGEFNGSLSAGLPVGDASDFTSFSLIIDFEYLFEIGEAIYGGPGLGYNTSFIKDNSDADNISFMPLTANARFDVSDYFTVGADVGYAIGIDDGNEGGFYVAPRVQYNIADKTSLVGALRMIKESNGSGNFTMLTFGVLIHLTSAAFRD